MQDLITIKEASEILGVTLSTVSYYVAHNKLVGYDSDQRTAHRKTRKLVSKAEVLQLKAKQDAKDAEKK